MNNQITILIIEDERPWADFLREFLQERGCRCTVADSGEEGLEAFRAEAHDVVLVDLRLPGIDGNEVTKKIRSFDEDAIIIMMTGYPTSESAVHAYESGATDYLTKPFNAGQVEVVINRVIEHRRMTQENERLRRLIESRSCFDQIVGAAPAMQSIYRLLEQIAPTDTPVLISGERGVGKSLAAEALHRASRRPNTSYTSLDCAEVAADHLEAALFGPRAGNGSGDKPGVLERAGEGTLYLAHVEALPPQLQSRLHQFLQGNAPVAAGGKRAEPLRARLVTSTSLPLREEAERGNFNRDLFFRLGVVNLDMPPLRERREDIPLLVNFLLEKVNRELQTQVDKFTFEATLVLSSYDWPGNVGELQDLIRELAADKRLGVLNVTDLPVSLQREMTFTDNSVSAADVPLRDAKRRFEREYFKDLLRRTKGNMSKASRNSRVGRPYLYKKINDYDINPNDYR